MAVVGLLWWRSCANQDNQNNQPQYRTAVAAREDVVRTINATGVLRTYNIVDVKSKASGIVSEIFVDVGDFVQKGQLLARIDLADTLSVYNQAKADLEAANACIEQAQESLQLQREQSELALHQAETDLASASACFEQAQERARTQPIITGAQFQSARTALETARTNLEQLEKVTIPQERAQAEANYNSARQSVMGKPVRSVIKRKPKPSPTQTAR